MFVRRVALSDFRGLRKLEWELDRKQRAPGWHVVIGDNGAGKSSVLRGIALALVGPAEAPGLRQNWNDWIRFGTGSSRLQVELERSRGDDPGGARRVALDVVLLRRPTPHLKAKRDSPVWSAPSGWFAASYGPFRRFTGGDREWDRLLESNPRPGRHLSIFSESVALTAGLDWLRSLEAQRLARQKDAGAKLRDVMRFVNQPGFLPHGMKLDEVTVERVVFRDAAKARVSGQNLSDGFRAMTSLTFELLRQLYLGFPGRRLFDASRRHVEVPGVVLIDEVDVHLHPTWQRDVGPWFCRHFPNMQFLVTTHSPLVCQASEQGTVFRLPTPGSNEQPHFITGIERARLVSGDASEAYGTGVFGLRETRSVSAQARMKELVQLNARALTKGLSATQRARREQLRVALPTAAALVAI